MSKDSLGIREIILWAVLLFMSFFFFVRKGCNIPVDESKYISKELYDASEDTMRKYRNKFHEEVTTTKLLTGTVSDLKSLSSSKDSSIQKLLKIVNKKTLSATIISNSTSGTVTASSTVARADTVRKDSLIYIYPEYTLGPVVSRWDSIYGVANKNDFTVKYKVFNQFEVSHEYQKQKVKGKIFKKNIAMVQVKNLNPKTETRELKGFTFEAPKKRQGRAFVAGAIVAVIVQTIISLKK